MSVSLKLEDLKDLQLEVDVARRLRLAAIAHVYPILPCFTCYSCLLSRITPVGMTQEMGQRKIRRSNRR
jgi:hypothetical protein